MGVEVFRAVTGILVLILLALEELLFQSFLKKGRICRSFCDSENAGTLGTQETKVLERIRLAQLLCLVALVFPLHSSADHLLFQAPGQMMLTALALQLIRTMGRRVLRHWSVLGEIVVIQAIFLVLGITISTGSGALPQGNWVTLLAIGTVFMKALNATALAFSITYASRGLFREGSRMFQSNPPMAFSDYWAGRVCSAAVPFALFSLAALWAGKAGTNRFQFLLCLSVALLLAAWTAFRFRRAHHPSAHAMIALSNLVLLTATLSGFSGG